MGTGFAAIDGGVIGPVIVGAPAGGTPGLKRLVNGGGVTVGAAITGEPAGTGTTAGATTLPAGGVVALVTGLAAAGTAGATEAVLAAGAGAAVPALLAPARDSPRTARRRMASRSAVSEASPSLVPGVWPKRARHVENSISRVVFTVIWCFMGVPVWGWCSKRWGRVRVRVPPVLPELSRPPVLSGLEQAVLVRRRRFWLMPRNLNF